MKTGEAGVITALAVLLAGGVFVWFSELPDSAAFLGGVEIQAELSVYDQLKLEIQPYHFARSPRESCKGDTTVWVADLDQDKYSIPQADLYITRALRNLEFTDIRAAERSAGGIVFNACFPNGQPIEIQITCPPGGQ